MKRYVSGKTISSSRTKETGRTVNNPLQLQAGTPPNNPLMLQVAPSAQVAGATTQRTSALSYAAAIPMVPGRQSFQLKSDIENLNHEHPAATAAVLQPMWEDDPDEEGVKVFRDYYAEYGITWFYDEGKDEMWFKLEEKGFAYEETLKKYQGMEEPYDFWERTWKENNWMEKTEAEKEWDAKRQAERELPEEPHSSTGAGGASRKGYVKTNRCVTVADDTTLWTFGLSGCITISILGSGTRTLAHCTADALTAGPSFYGSNGDLVAEVAGKAAGASRIIVTVESLTFASPSARSVLEAAFKLPKERVTYMVVGNAMVFDSAGNVIDVKSREDRIRYGIE